MRGELADDLHHFRLTLDHNDGVVTAVDAESVRYPWSTCPGAESELRSLVGAPLAERTESASRHADARANCTHMFDLASLAMTQAWRATNGDRREAPDPSARRRQYDVEITTEPDTRGAVRTRLWRDRELLLEWQLQNPHGPRTILAPEPYASVPFDRGFFRWSATELEPGLAEAAFVLRRACDISRGRGMALDDMPVEIAFAPPRLGVCFAKTAGRTSGVTRNLGQTRDFAGRPDAVFDDA